MPDVALIILAAGNSSRLGEPKQLKVFAGKTLLEHTIDAALASACSPVLLVLGADKEKMQMYVDNKPIESIHNSAWAEGMGSSISTAVAHLEKTQPDLKALVICTCDQPFLSASIIDSLVGSHKEHQQKPIVASRYAGINGVPALFTRELFPELRKLKGSEGARKIIMQNEDRLALVDFPQGAIDIDTESDWNAFLDQAQIAQ